VLQQEINRTAILQMTMVMTMEMMKVTTTHALIVIDEELDLPVGERRVRSHPDEDPVEEVEMTPRQNLAMEDIRILSRI